MFTKIKKLILAVASMASLGAKSESTDPSKVMAEMRLKWLESWNIENKTEPSKSELVAVVLDYPLGDNTITILASKDGDASLYTTGTFGILGGIGHSKVRTAAANLVNESKMHLSSAKPVKSYPYPDGSHLFAYFVTSSGVLKIEGSFDPNNGPGENLKSIFMSAQDLLTELRLITQQQKGD